MIENVLSYFDGCSCGQVALNRANIQYNNYLAAEIDPYAITITQKNYPNTRQLGDVTKLDISQLPEIDLLLGGSPCQSFSRVGNGKGFEGKSGLFWEFAKVLKSKKPKHFLFENVIMRKDWADVITEELGVNPIRFNSNLLSGQNRDRYYWSNIKFNLPKDTGVTFSSVLEDLPFKPIIPSLKGFWGDKKSPRMSGSNWVGNNKSNCLTTKSTHPDQYLLNEDKSLMRTLTPNEFELLQTLPVNYTFGVNNGQRFKMIGNGQTVDVIAYILSHIEP